MSVANKIKMGALTAVAAAAMTLSATGASAAVYVVGPIGPGGTSYDVNNVTANFSDELQFSLSSSVLASALLSTISSGGAGNLNFTGAYLDVAGNAFTFSPTGTFEFGVLEDLVLSAGTHSIFVSGTHSGTVPGSYSLDVAVSAVPEPATWGMMLVGFGLVGAGIRSRRRSMVLA